MKWFYSLKIARRLMLLNLTAALALFLITGFGIYQTHRVYEAASYSTDNTVPSLEILARAADAFDDVRLLTGKYISASDPQAAKSIEDSIARKSEQARSAFKTYESITSDDKDRALLAADREAAAKAEQVREQAITLARDGKKEEAFTLFTTQSADAVQLRSAALSAHRAYNAQLGKQVGNDVTPLGTPQAFTVVEARR